MNKLPLLFSLGAIALLLGSCHKERNARQLSPDALLIQQAHQYFSDSVLSVRPALAGGSGNPRLSCPRVPQWDSAYTIPTVIGKAVVVPVRYSKSLHVRTSFSGLKLFDLNELTRLVIYQDDGHRYHAEMVTSFPDSVALRGGGSPFTGILFVEDWMGQRLHQFKYNTDGTILRGDVPQGQVGKREGVAGASTRSVTPDVVMTNCYEIDGYNYSEADPDGGYAWSEPAGCSSSFYPEAFPLANTGGMSGSNYGNMGGSRFSVTNILVTNGPNHIGNAQDYFKCFTNVGGSDHRYTVTVCVDQPTPGTRQAWGFSSGVSGTSARGNPVDVGHAFLIFSETYGGTTIIRNVGFYPQSSVNPLYPSDQGQLNDNEGSIYNISLTISLDDGQFFNMLNFVSQGNNPGFLYNLNTNNCTTFALSALSAGSVNLSTVVGTWPGGSGFDPGDLGEDIRNMPLSSNMTRSTSETSHPNVGICN